MAAPAIEPIFVHSWWRTSSTYVWGKLREIEGLCCYSEPLHETVGMLTLAMTRGAVDAAAVGRLHHPPMKRPYFAEYEPLMRAGAPGFAKELSYDRYFLHPQEVDTQLEGYLRRLLDAAAARGKRPVLALCRSSLRAAWMRRRFGGVHLALVRNPRHQWGSMLEQHRLGGTYFLAGVLAIASKLQTRFPRAFSHLRCRLIDFRGSRYNPTELGRYLAQARLMDLEDAYGVFILLWMASALQILSVCGLVIDSDRLTADPEARARIELRLAAGRLAVDLSDYATPIHSDLPLPPGALERIEGAAVKALSSNALALTLYHPDRVRARFGELEPFSARLLDRALTALAPAPGTTAAPSVEQAVGPQS